MQMVLIVLNVQKLQQLINIWVFQRNLQSFYWWHVLIKRLLILRPSHYLTFTLTHFGPSLCSSSHKQLTCKGWWLRYNSLTSKLIRHRQTRWWKNTANNINWILANLWRFVLIYYYVEELWQNLVVVKAG